MHTRQLLGAALLALTATTARAQSAADKLKEGDAALLAKNPSGALTAYNAALASSPKNVTALWHAAHAAVISGEYAGDKQDSLYKLAESYARKAVAAGPKDAGAHFALAEALGRIAQNIDSPISKLPYSREVYAEVNQCLALKPKSPECDHILGVWNMEVMKIDEGQRSMAVSFMGATEIGEASWAKATKYLQRAITAEPKRVVHHVDLGRTYAAMGDKAKAKAELNKAVSLPSTDYNDEHYKADAKQLLQTLGKS